MTAQPLPDPLDQQDADKFLTTCSNLLGLLAKPDIQPAILELKKVQDTTIGNLLGFMHAFNLRFGRATTLKQQQAYHQLFEVLDQTRDQILSEAKLDGTATASATPAHATQFFQNLNQVRLQPPRPGNPQ